MRNGTRRVETRFKKALVGVNPERVRHMPIRIRDHPVRRDDCVAFYSNDLRLRLRHEQSKSVPREIAERRQNGASHRGEEKKDDRRLGWGGRNVGHDICPGNFKGGGAFPVGGAAGKFRSLPHIEYLGVPTRYLHRISGSTRHHGLRERRAVRYRSTRRIGLVLSYDPESLLTAVIATQRDGCAEGCRVSMRRRRNELGARAPRAPVADFAHCGGGGMRIGSRNRFPVRLLEASNSRLDRSKAFGSDKVAVPGNRPLGQLPDVLVVFPDEGAAHGDERFRTGGRFALSASMRFEASALVNPGANASGSLHCSDNVLRYDACAPVIGSFPETQSSGSFSAFVFGLGSILGLVWLFIDANLPASGAVPELFSYNAGAPGVVPEPCHRALPDDMCVRDSKNERKSPF
jgi:hypothetical protein